MRFLLVISQGFILLVFCLSGCVCVSPKQPIYHAEQEPTVVFYPTESNNLLSCVQDSKELTRAEFKAYIKALNEKEGEKSEQSHLTETEQLRYICLSLHNYASYRQFKKGMGYLNGYINVHPDERKSLQGVMLLMERINQETVRRWALSNRLNDEKEVLEADNEALMEEVSAREDQNELDKERIEELQKQIEQLKNIENIIKNREL